MANHPEVPDSRAIQNRISFQAVIREAVLMFNSRPEELTQSRRGQTNPKRAIVMYVARRKFGHKLVDIAQAFRCSSYSVVGTAISRLEKAMKNNSLLIEQAEHLERNIRKTCQ